MVIRIILFTIYYKKIGHFLVCRSINYKRIPRDFMYMRGASLVFVTQVRDGYNEIDGQCANLCVKIEKEKSGQE